MRRDCAEQFLSLPQPFPPGTRLDYSQYAVSVTSWQLRENGTATAELTLQLNALNGTQDVFVSMYSSPIGIGLASENSSTFCRISDGESCTARLVLVVNVSSFESDTFGYIVSLVIDPLGHHVDLALKAPRKLCPDVPLSPHALIQGNLTQASATYELRDGLLQTQIWNRGQGSGPFSCQLSCSHKIFDAIFCHLEPNETCPVEFDLTQRPYFACNLTFTARPVACVVGQEYTIIIVRPRVVYTLPVYYTIPIYVVLGLMALLYMFFLIAWIVKLCTECGITRDNRQALAKQQAFFQEKMARKIEAQLPELAIKSEE